MIKYYIYCGNKDTTGLTLTTRKVKNKMENKKDMGGITLEEQTDINLTRLCNGARKHKQIETEVLEDLNER